MRLLALSLLAALLPSCITFGDGGCNEMPYCDRDHIASMGCRCWSPGVVRVEGTSGNLVCRCPAKEGGK